MNTKTIKQGSGRLSYLDGLRGTAALCVVVHHFFSVFVAGQNDRDQVLITALTTLPLRITNNGPFCVFVFFALSGFVLAESVANGKSTLQARLIARYFRLTIPMVASLILAWALILLFRDARLEVLRMDPDLLQRSPFIYPGVTANFSQVLKDGFYGVYVYGGSPFNDVVWTMHYELLGSFGIYFVYRFSPKKYRWVAILIAGCITLDGPTYLGFAIGAGLREAWAAGWLRDTKWAWAALAAAIFIGCEGRMNYFADASTADSSLTTTIDNDYRYFYSAAAALLLFSVFTLPGLRSAFDTKVPRFLGRISFALYLVHVPILGSIMLSISLYVGAAFYVNLFVLFVIFLVLAIGAAWVMTIVLDEPLTSRLHHVKRLPSLRQLVFRGRNVVVARK